MEERQPELGLLLDDSEQYHTHLAELVEEFPGIARKVFKVKCAAHSVQLILWDGLKASDAVTIIQMCRIAVKILRKPRNQQEIQAAGIATILPKYDCPTRWSSTYLMVCAIFISYLTFS